MLINSADKSRTMGQLGTARAAHVANKGVEPGHDDAFNRNWGGTLHEIGPTTHTASGQAFAGPAVYGGWLVQAVTAAAVIRLRHGTDVNGPVIDTIPVGSEIGDHHVLPGQMDCPTGCSSISTAAPARCGCWGRTDVPTRFDR